MGKGDFIWKLIDFGFSVDLSTTRIVDKFVGTFDYASPLLKKKFLYPDYNIQSDPFKDDVYSLGVTLLEICTNFRTYNEEAKKTLHNICEEKFLISLIDMMLEN